MNYDFILTTLDSSMIELAVAAVHAGNSVALVLSPSTQYSEDEYASALSDILPFISSDDVPRVLGLRELSLKTWRQQLWKHLKNKLQLCLNEQRCELLQHLATQGIDIYESEFTQISESMICLSHRRVKMMISYDVCLDSSLHKFEVTQAKIPSYIEKSQGFVELFQRKSAPEAMLVDQAESLNGMTPAESLLQELADLLEIKLYDLDQTDCVIKWGITLDGKARVKNGILKGVVFDLIWYPLHINVFGSHVVEDELHADDLDWQLLPFLGV